MIVNCGKSTPLADYRRRTGLNRNKVSCICGITYKTLYLIERGDLQITNLRNLTQRLSIMKFYGMNPDKVEGISPVMPFTGISRAGLDYRIRYFDESRNIIVKTGLKPRLVYNSKQGRYNYKFLVALCKSYRISLSQFLSE